MKKLIFILVGVLLIACRGSDRPSKPNNLIAKEKMSEIIYDVFLLSAAKGINKQILEYNGVFPQEYVFKKHQIDSLQFALSNDYYAYDTKTYEGIIQNVKQKIEAEKAKNDALNIKEQKTKDSLKEVVKKLAKSDTLPLLKKKLKLKTFGKNKD